MWGVGAEAEAERLECERGEEGIEVEVGIEYLIALVSGDGLERPEIATQQWRQGLRARLGLEKTTGFFFMRGRRVETVTVTCGAGERLGLIVSCCGPRVGL